MQLKDKVALITGAGQGIGKGFAEALIKKGAKVCVTDISLDQGQRTVDELTSQYGEGKAIFVKCDVTSQEDMENSFSQCKSVFGQLDIVCNNAGLGNEMKWDLTVDINIKGVIRGTMLAIEHLRKDKGGNGGIVLNVASMAGLVPVPFGPVYCATKHAVVGLTRSWAVHLDTPGMGINFCTLCPSFVETQLIHATDNGEMYYPEKARSYIQQVGVMSVDYVADEFIKLLEDDNNNGAVLKLTKKDGSELVQFK